ncbi:MAG TPA: winged helix-turn-helix domain-containing protein [Gammaproteobacteria bacterium]|nr:winged helix-turn-helix domain-containing protein [Gammaproteobacteria bacterium]
MQRLGDILAERALAQFTGRQRELATLLGLFETRGPLVVHVHGVAGIGKSSLLEAFAGRARALGIRVIRIDCRTVEPTARGFLAELSDALGESLGSVETVAQRLSSFNDPVAIILDTYEAFTLLDTWIRQIFVPSLPLSARLAIGGRNPPSPAWRTTPGGQGLFRSLPLDSLPEADALHYLALSGIPADSAQRINGVARGHPLALSMSASIALSDPGHRIEDVRLHHVINELSRTYIEAVPDAITRQALEASAVVRCVTEPLLHALIPDIAPRDAMERLSALPFVDLGREGLFIHEAVRGAVASSLAARDPDTHREYRRAAWVYLQNRMRHGSGRESWRHTADLLFLLENPILREGFFPSGAQPLAVEPATSADGEAVLRLVAAKAAPEREALTAWWRYNAEAFRVVRDRERNICGFLITIRASDLHEAVVAADPLAAFWQRDAATRGPSAALFCRRWLDRDAGEAPSASQGACWVDLKRTYVELRGTLRWVYSAVVDPVPYAGAIGPLGFRPLAGTVDVGGQQFHSALLDMGPGSVDAWLAGLIGAEIAIEESRAAKLLDVDGRELVLAAGRVQLTSLEFGVMQYLQEHPGKAVSRYDLMEAVWGHRLETASNVVDVVVRSLREKLGVESTVIETVRGTGYRFRAPASAS